MALKTAEDKAKVRTAIKIYLALKGNATANQLDKGQYHSNRCGE